jgi:hypothetical protein
VLLKLALWQDVQDYLEKRTDVVIPVGGKIGRAHV